MIDSLLHALLILLQVAGALSLIAVIAVVVSVRYFGCVFHLEYVEGDEDEDYE